MVVAFSTCFAKMLLFEVGFLCHTEADAPVESRCERERTASLGYPQGCEGCQNHTLDA